MKHLKTFESWISNKISQGLETQADTYSNPITRPIAGQGIDYLSQTDRLPNDSCDKCEYYKSKRKNYCGKCSNCLLSEEETKAKMTLAKSDRDKFQISGCMKKHGLKF